MKTIKSPLFLLWVSLLIFTIATSVIASSDEKENDQNIHDYEDQDLDTEELDAEEDETDVGSLEPEKKNLLGDKPVEINIAPVEPDEFSCTGLENGKQVDPNPNNCLSFFVCINETAYKIHCPKIPDQTYYNPIKQVCDNSDENFCKNFVGLPDDKKNEDSDSQEFTEGETITQKIEL